MGYNGAHMVIRGPYCQRVVLGSLIVCFNALDDRSFFFSFEGLNEQCSFDSHFAS